MAKVKKLKVKTNKHSSKLDSYIHFGYEVVEKIENGNKTTYSLSKNTSLSSRKYVDNLRKDYKKVSKIFPTRAIVHFLIAGILIGGYYFLNLKMPTFAYIQYSWALIVLGLMFAGPGLFYFITFIFVLFGRKKMMNEIIKEADQFTGVRTVFPLPENIVNGEQDSLLLRKMATGTKEIK